MKISEQDLRDPDNKILIILPNINDSIIAAALMMDVIDRTDVSVIFMSNDKIDELKVCSKIKKIYLLGIGPQNCESSRLASFLEDHREKIYFWVNNCSNLNHVLSDAAMRCPNLSVTFGNKPYLTQFLIDVFRISSIRKDWLIAMDALANHKKTFPNAMALRFQKAAYAAEVMAQYNNSYDLAADTRIHLLSELLSDSVSERVDKMIKMHQKIKEENRDIIDNLKEHVLRLTESCGLIIQHKRIFDRKKIFGELLSEFNPAIIQYSDIKGNHLTEIMMVKDLKDKTEAVAEALKDADYKVCRDKSKITVKGDWQAVRNIVVAELSL